MFRRKPIVSAPPEWLIVGLGNPGAEYRGTRHNVGFALIDQLAETHRIKLDRSRHQARIGSGTLAGHGVLLAKPLTYMNLSGRAVAPLARDHRLAPNRVLVIADDLDLPLGKLRFRESGGAGGHNGHRSIIQALGTQDYPRLRVGIGKAMKSETVDHVLSRFDPDEKPLIDDALQAAADAISALIGGGPTALLQMLERYQRTPNSEAE